jgi:antitoxin HigA-1
MKKLQNIHPGEILQEEFLEPLGITAYRLSKDVHIPATRISQIIKGRRSISADTALRFSKYFGTTADFWLGLQMEFDLRQERASLKKELNSIKTVPNIRKAS